MDYLTFLNSDTLRLIRHISVRDHPFPNYLETGKGSYNTYSFPTVLSWFPGLQLSTLVVRDTYHEPGTMDDAWGHDAVYEDVEHLIKSDGFKELVYISAHDRLMMSNHSHASVVKNVGYVVRTTHRDAQPSTGDKMIKERDGVDSGAGVDMSRLTND